MCDRATSEAFRKIDFEGTKEHLALFTRILYKLREAGMALILPEVGKSKGFGARTIGNVAVTRVSEDKCIVLKPQNLMEYLTKQANTTAN